MVENVSKVMLIPTTDKHEEYNAVLASTITNMHRYKSAVVIRLNNVVSYHIECANEDSAKSILSSMILNWQIALETRKTKMNKSNIDFKVGDYWTTEYIKSLGDTYKVFRQALRDVYGWRVSDQYGVELIYEVIRVTKYYDLTGDSYLETDTSARTTQEITQFLKDNGYLPEMKQEETIEQMMDRYRSLEGRKKILYAEHEDIASEIYEIVKALEKKGLHII